MTSLPNGAPALSAPLFVWLATLCLMHALSSGASLPLPGVSTAGTCVRSPRAGALPTGVEERGAVFLASQGGAPNASAVETVSHVVVRVYSITNTVAQSLRKRLKGF